MKFAQHLRKSKFELQETHLQEFAGTLLNQLSLSGKGIEDSKRFDDLAQTLHTYVGKYTVNVTCIVSGTSAASKRKTKQGGLPNKRQQLHGPYASPYGPHLQRGPPAGGHDPTISATQQSSSSGREQLVETYQQHQIPELVLRAGPQSQYPLHDQPSGALSSQPSSSSADHNGHCHEIQQRVGFGAGCVPSSSALSEPDNENAMQVASTSSVPLLAAIKFDKATLMKIIFQYPLYINGAIWFGSPPGFPQFISIPLCREAGEIIRPVGRDCVVPDRSCHGLTEANPSLIELESFKQMIQRDGFGSIFWNEREDGGFVSVEVVEDGLETNLVQVVQSADTTS
jgi:hypothetical protein